MLLFSQEICSLVSEQNATLFKSSVLVNLYICLMSQFFIFLYNRFYFSWWWRFYCSCFNIVDVIFDFIMKIPVGFKLSQHWWWPTLHSGLIHWMSFSSFSISFAFCPHHCQFFYHLPSCALILQHSQFRFHLANKQTEARHGQLGGSVGRMSWKHFPVQGQ